MKRLFFIAMLSGLSLLTFGQQKQRGAAPSPQNLPPEPNFSWINTCYGDSTCFINQTIRGYTYTWTVWADSVTQPFGVIVSYKLYTNKKDSQFCFKFPHPGTYTVDLNAYDNHYANITKILTIDTITKAVFDFQGCTNNFINNSTCASTFLWDFGDGAQSTLATPVHQYADTGLYVVSLIAYNGIKSDTMVKSLHVTIDAEPNGSWTYSAQDSVVNFQPAIVSKFSTYSWYFGDFVSATGNSVTHAYKDSTASYAVTMTAINACGYSATTDTVSIVKYIPHIDFSSNLMIAPNPVTNNGFAEVYYKTDFDADYIVSLYDALGQSNYRALFSFKAGINEFKLNATSLSDGIYFLIMESGNSYIRKKMEIRRAR